MGDPLTRTDIRDVAVEREQLDAAGAHARPSPPAREQLIRLLPGTLTCDRAVPISRSRYASPRIPRRGNARPGKADCPETARGAHGDTGRAGTAARSTGVNGIRANMTEQDKTPEVPILLCNR